MGDTISALQQMSEYRVLVRSDSYSPACLYPKPIIKYALRVWLPRQLQF